MLSKIINLIEQLGDEEKEELFNHIQDQYTVEVIETKETKNMAEEIHSEKINGFIDVNSKKNQTKYKYLIGHYDASDPGHTRGDREHFEELLEMSLDDAMDDEERNDIKMEIERIQQYHSITVGE